MTYSKNLSLKKKKIEYPVRAFRWNMEKEVCFHNDDLRNYNIHRTHESGAVGKMPVHKWFKDFEEPTVKIFFQS